MNLKDLEIKKNTPYPDIIDARDDRSTVAILKTLATSRSSELSAILTYIFQSTVADKTMEEVASIIEEISIVEMMHLDMLMHAIVDFGGVPRYEDGQGLPFNSNSLNYTTKLREMLDNNIASENLAIEGYREAIGLVKNDSLKKLFARIIEDEECHIAVFKYIRDTVKFLSV